MRSLKKNELIYMHVGVRRQLAGVSFLLHCVVSGIELRSAVSVQDVLLTVPSCWP